MTDTTELRRLREKILIEGRLVVLTGLHIGGNDAGLAIGGADKLVVRRPKDGTPYVPGSSLKGKLRSLLERTGASTAKVDSEKLECRPCACGTCRVCLVFGVPASEKPEERRRRYEEGKPFAGASRVFVRDAYLANPGEVKAMPQLDMPYTEVKTEVAIDRLTSTANPRVFERVPAGSEFSFAIVLDVFEHDDSGAHLGLLKEALALLGDDALGGQGSRGYGQIEIHLERIARVPVSAYGNAEELRKARGANELAAPIVYGGASAARQADA